jgi:hypothetical protein
VLFFFSCLTAILCLDHQVTKGRLASHVKWIDWLHRCRQEREMADGISFILAERKTKLHILIPLVRLRVMRWQSKESGLAAEQGLL